MIDLPPGRARLRGAFASVAVPDALFDTEESAETFSRLSSFGAEGPRLAVLTGEAGTGKTTMLHRVMAAWQRSGSRTMIESLPLGLDDLRARLPGAEPGRDITVGLDEAQALPRELLGSLDAILAARPDVRLILVGGPRLEDTFGELRRQGVRLPAMVQRRLAPLAASEVGAYIDCCWRASGVGPCPFAPGAVEKIAAASDGIPQVINVLCSRLVRLADLSARGQVTADMVDEVTRELLRGPEPRRRAPAGPRVDARSLRLASVGVAAALIVLVAVLVAERLSGPALRRVERPAPTAVLFGLEHRSELPKVASRTPNALGPHSAPNGDLAAVPAPPPAAVSPPRRTDAAAPADPGPPVQIAAAPQVPVAPAPPASIPTAPAASVPAPPASVPPIPPVPIPSAAPAKVPLAASASGPVAPPASVTAAPPTAPPALPASVRPAPPVLAPAASASVPAASTAPASVAARGSAQAVVGNSSGPVVAAAPILPPRPPIGSPPLAPVTRRDTARDDALLRRAEEGNVQAIRALLADGASPGARDASGFTALMLAVIHGHAEAVDALVAAGAGVNAQNGAGLTPVMLAAINNHTAVIAALADRGAELNQRTRAGWTALTYAAWRGHADAVRLLLARGADPNVTDREGWTVLQYASWRAAEPIPREDLPGVPAGADVSRVTGGGPAHKEIVALLRRAGVRR